MDIAHAGGQVSDLQPFSVEYVGVAAESGGEGLQLDPEVLSRALHQPHNRRVVRNMHAVVVALDLRFDGCLKTLAIQFQNMAGRGFFEALQHVLRLALQLFLVVAPGSTPQHDRVWDNVDGHAALDDANVSRGLVVDTSQPHTRDAFGSYLDRANSLLGTGAGMGLQPADAKLHAIGGGRLGE